MPINELILKRLQGRKYDEMRHTLVQCRINDVPLERCEYLLVIKCRKIYHFSVIVQNTIY